MLCKLGSKISSGSFGDVYKVECKDPETSDIKSKENYAIKIIQNSIYGIRCISELLILLFLKYSYLMNCFQYQIDFDTNVTKILMPLATCDFRSKLLKINYNKHNAKNPRTRFVLWQIVCAIGFLHNNGIIHGDIKPSNILLYKNEVKLADFSLSSFHFKESDRILRESYTEHYRSPEIWNNLGYSYKADVWALGCTFYEIIYNKRYIPEKADKILLEETDIDFRQLLKSMLELDENKRLNIFEVMKSNYFKDNFKDFKYEENFSLKYPTRTLENENMFIENFIKIISPFHPDIPKYVYEIITMKIFRKPIDKAYNIYLDSFFIESEHKILETLINQNLGLTFLNF
jgi:serine/threonine protein kinase